MKNNSYTTQFYTYYPSKIKVIACPNYERFLRLIQTNKKKTKSKTSNNFAYFFILWCSSFIYKHKVYDKILLKGMIKSFIGDNNIDEELLTIAIDKAIFTYMNYPDGDLKHYYTIAVNFVWDNKALFDFYKSDFEQINNYKRKTILKVNNEQKELEKENNIRKDIELYIKNNYYKCQIINILNKTYDLHYIYKIISEYEIKERSKSFINLDKAINLILSKDIHTKITIDNLVEVLNGFSIWDEFTEEYIIIKVSKRTINNYLKETPEMKEKIKIKNTKIVPIIIEDEEEFKPYFEKSKNNLSFFDEDDEVLNFKKIISWDESIELEKRSKMEWNDEDDLFIQKRKAI